MDFCLLQGEESAKIHGNTNCTKLPLPIFWDQEANQRCIKKFKTGCAFAKENQFCRLGTTNFVIRGNCALAHPFNELGASYYKSCCKACAEGKETYLAGKTLELPLKNATGRQTLLYNEYVKCFSCYSSEGSLSCLESLQMPNPCQNGDYFDIWEHHCIGKVIIYHCKIVKFYLN